MMKLQLPQVSCVPPGRVWERIRSQEPVGSAMGAESPEKAKGRNPEGLGGEMGVLAVPGNGAMLR